MPTWPDLEVLLRMFPMHILKDVFYANIEVTKCCIKRVQSSASTSVVSKSFSSP